MGHRFPLLRQGKKAVALEIHISIEGSEDLWLESSRHLVMVRGNVESSYEVGEQAY